jgi:hypothetical protein
MFQGPPEYPQSWIFVLKINHLATLIAIFFEIEKRSENSL